jgi:hypothetical protein
MAVPGDDGSNGARRWRALAALPNVATKLSGMGFASAVEPRSGARLYPRGDRHLRHRSRDVRQRFPDRQISPASAASRSISNAYDAITADFQLRGALAALLGARNAYWLTGGIYRLLALVGCAPCSGR